MYLFWLLLFLRWCEGGLSFFCCVCFCVRAHAASIVVPAAFGGDGSSTGVKVGVGAGVRWRSPVGPARIDLAHPLDDDTIVRLHLRIGPDL